MKYTDIMLDLETLGTSSDAAILAIGAVAFNLEDADTIPALINDPFGRTFHCTVDLNGQIEDYGRKVDAGAFYFWMNQPNEARNALMGEKCGLFGALVDFNAWVSGHNENARLWGNSSTFDNVILRSAYKAANCYFCLGFRQDCCYRTLRGLFLPKAGKGIGKEMLVKHNALHDAIYQTVVAQRAYKAARVA